MVRYGIGDGVFLWEVSSSLLVKFGAYVLGEGVHRDSEEKLT